MKPSVKIIILTCSFLVNIFVVSAQPNWALQVSGTSFNLKSVAFTNSFIGYAVGEKGIILRTSDGGINWSVRQSRNDETIFDVVSIDSTSACTGGELHNACYDVLCGIVHRTNDMGLNWYYNDLGGLIYAMSYSSTTKGLAVGYNYNGWGGYGYATVHRFDSDDNIWRFFVMYYQGQMVDKIFTDVANPQQDFSLAVTSDGSIFKWQYDTASGYSGTSIWDSLANFSTQLNSVSFYDTLNGVVVGNYGTIWKTTDGGNTWQQQVSNTTQQLNSVYFLSVDEGYVAGNSGTILHTTDGGATWTSEISGTTRNLNKILFTDAEHGWAVGENGVILKYGSFATCKLSKTTMDYGSINNKSELEGTVQIKNKGTIPLTVSSIVSDDSVFTSNLSDITVPVGGTAYVVITFRPLTPGEKSGNIIFTHNAFPFIDTVSVRGTSLDFDTTFVEVNAKWNLVSNPRLVTNNSRSTLFPSAVTDAFQYDAGSGYTQTNTILNGRGYWLKFNAPSITKIAGVVITNDTLDVQAGWNLIGTISHPVNASSITNIPEGIVSSKYYEFENGYIEATNIQPGRAYWVKVTANGKLVLTNP
jgi:photosystem II stability/assembly factor-like uncharacterized protein